MKTESSSETAENKQPTEEAVSGAVVGQQQPWVAMVMQQPHHYIPYHPHQGGGSNNRTIWVGDLRNWMDEDYLATYFASTNQVASIKVIRNKHTGFPEGYGLVEFYSHASAEKVLQTFSCTTMPNADQPFRLNWASFSMGDKRSNNGSNLSIFVDANTGRSRGYGFVRFGDHNERSQAMTEIER
ncbi:hypothetical protein K7X08_028965 [Anisodus acutangulus]|uniref:RRM domain-containing protein n=1 Tax=Anisodus acutangulus TaxID=402998 RepID=A0A9Q1QSF9_9SOLA|nr:hypothetical protein K7X08_028965 [Anisodus acutangulus]